MKKTILAIVVLAAILFLISLIPHKNTAPVGTNGSPMIASVFYSCSAGKTITADFSQGSADVKLSDGRDMTLKQTISADGVRYANSDESFVFWSKGNGALVLENNVQKSYIGCVKVSPDTGGLPNIYSDASGSFSLRYPAGYTVDENYQYQALGPGKTIAGVKFTIPTATAKGTNLSNDSYVSVEQIAGAPSCDASLFAAQGATITTQTIGNTTYSVATSSDAGAGNRYDETVYALPGTNPCVAVREFVHYSVFENYPAGTVAHYDAAALATQMDSIRDSLTINQ